ncbi:MAG: hypothetical protein V4819_16310, partial [Verrucomicrobiota bacterium]
METESLAGVHLSQSKRLVAILFHNFYPSTWHGMSKTERLEQFVPADTNMIAAPPAPSKSQPKTVEEVTAENVRTIDQ